MTTDHSPGGDLVPTFATKLTELARSPRARAAIEKARQQVDKPENRRRLEQLRTRWAGRGSDKT
jgi:streptomycin 6-kinase